MHSHYIAACISSGIPIASYNDSCEEKEWKLTQEEKEFFHKMMEDYCMQKNGCTLREFFDRELG